MNIKAIAFDLGGVLFEEGKANALDSLAKKYNYDRDVVLDILKSPKSILLRKGQLSDEEFWSWAQTQLPLGYNALVIKQAWYEGYILDKDILDLIKKLHGKYRLIVFSSNIKSRVEYLEQKNDFRKYFDLEVYSFDYNAHKPEKEFFDSLIKQSFLQPREMVLIDDNRHVAVKARKYGIPTLVYQKGDIASLKNELNRLGIVT